MQGKDLVKSVNSDMLVEKANMLKEYIRSQMLKVKSAEENLKFEKEQLQKLLDMDVSKVNIPTIPDKESYKLRSPSWHLNVYNDLLDTHKRMMKG